MTEDWASMPLMDDEDSEGLNYGVHPKYSIDAGTVIHHGDKAYFPLMDESDNHKLLSRSDVRVLTDREVVELEQQLPYPLPSGAFDGDIDNQQERVGLGDVIAKITHMLEITECTAVGSAAAGLIESQSGGKRKNNSGTQRNPNRN